MTSNVVPPGLADLPFAERQRREAEDWTAIRAAMVGRHFETTEDGRAIAGGVLAHNIGVQLLRRAVLAGQTPVPPVPVAPPEPEPVPEVAPAPSVVITERARPDNLRERLGLR